MQFNAFARWNAQCFFVHSFAWLAIGLTSLAIGTAFAQSLPVGSYVNTCTQAQMSGTTLVAQCKDRDGSYRQSFLSNPFNCAVGIENADGILTCRTWAQQSRPNFPLGNYQQSCDRLQMTADTMTGHCRDRSGVVRESFLLNAFNCVGGVENVDGSLKCIGGRPNSSSNQPTPTALAAPQGSYLNSCRNAQATSAKYLYAICARSNGASLHTVLIDYQDCQSDIYNENGYLRCRLRGGGMNRALRALTIQNQQSLLAIDTVKLKERDDSDWTEYLTNGSIQPRQRKTIFLDSNKSCNMRVRIGSAWDKVKDDWDTCTFATFKENDNDYTIE